MTSKKWIAAAVALLVVIAGVWRWLGHSATEADDGDHPVTGEAVIAAVARVQRGPMDSTLTIAGEFKPFQGTWTSTQKSPATSRRFMWMLAIM